MRVSLVCCPSWSVNFPPYNISLLKAILKENGHDVKNFDMNIEAYHFLKNEDIDFWGGQNYFYWMGEKFDKILLPKLTKFMDDWIDKILDYKPDFIGFTVYHTSIRFITFMSERIRQKNDKVKIMIGGPQCFSAGKDPLYTGIADYIITGEGEDAILEALKCPTNKDIPAPKLTNINNLPVPNYEDYDLSKYTRKNGVSLETSRGCIAKCAFCIETHYWSYRSKRAEVVFNEIKECVEKYGAVDFRFNDSLVNGNIKEFYKLVTLLAESDLNITWDGYARINKKMDYAFIKKIKDSGNILLSYGIESGSQKVLDAMNKGIRVEEIEENLENGYKVSLFNHVNWMVGFPNEKPIDALYSLVFLFNNRKYINNISPGMTCGIGEKATLQVHGEEYNILPEFLWDNFVTKDFRNTAINRFIRLKITHIWLDLLNIVDGQYHPKIKDHYGISFLDETILDKRINYEECPNFDYLDINFHSSLYTEYLSFFWLIYRVFGAYQMTLKFDKIMDIEEFGKDIAKEYYADVKFSINKKGEWLFNIKHSLETVKPFTDSFVLNGVF